MSDNRTRIWFALFVLAVFSVGLASGVLIGRRVVPAPAGGPGFGMRGMGPGPGGGAPPGRLIERLDVELRFTPDQRAQVEQIFEARRRGLEAVQHDVLARAEKEQRELQEEIRKVLTPEQQQRFDKWLADAPRGRRGRGPGMGTGPLR
jgi:Spy/CpxP family protein refolding chaperone